MRPIQWLLPALLAMVPGLAHAHDHAECRPRFAEGATQVQLAASENMDSQQLVERFYVRVRNDGNSECRINLIVGRDPANTDEQFPSFTLTGPNGNIPVIPLAGARSNPNTSIPLIIPANGQKSVPFDIRMQIGWGAEAGLYRESLQYVLTSGQSGDDFASQRTELNLNIPATARIRFSGAQGSDGQTTIDLGELSTSARTVSSPFAMRVLSTTPYQMRFESQNHGALLRSGGSEQIFYQMLVSGRQLNLRGSGDSMSIGHHTGPSGDLHPIVITVDPDPTWHAGDYADRVTVTVTPI